MGVLDDAMRLQNEQAKEAEKTKRLEIEVEIEKVAEMRTANLIAYYAALPSGESRRELFAKIRGQIEQRLDLA